MLLCVQSSCAISRYVFIVFVKSRDGFCFSDVPCGRFKKQLYAESFLYLFCNQDVLVNLYLFLETQFYDVIV